MGPATSSTFAGSKPRSVRLQLDEAAHQHAGRRQQHQRQRDLDDDEGAAQPSAAEAAAGPLARVAQRVHEIAA